jgi:hypothetical protein
MSGEVMIMLLFFVLVIALLSGILGALIVVANRLKKINTNK